MFDQNFQELKIRYEIGKKEEIFQKEMLTYLRKRDQLSKQQVNEELLQEERKPRDWQVEWADEEFKKQETEKEVEWMTIALLSLRIFI